LTFKKPYVKKTKGPRIIGGNKNEDHAVVEFSGIRNFKLDRETALIKENMGKAVYWNQV